MCSFDYRRLNAEPVMAAVSGRSVEIFEGRPL